MAAERYERELKGTSYELFMLLVSLLSIVNTVIVVLASPGVVRDVALLMDTILAPVLLVDFLYRLLTAEPRHAYLVRSWGWADLLSAIPVLGFFRVFRIVRTTRLLRARGGPQLIQDVALSRAVSTFLLTMFLVILVVELAGIAVFYVELGAPGSNIDSASDAVWWGLVTITTVGYGDQFPTTGGGRIVGAFLLFAGIALFSVLTGFIANVFLSPSSRPRRRRGEPGSVAAEAAELRRLLDEQDQRTAAIRSRLDEIERAAVRERDAARLPEA